MSKRVVVERDARDTDEARHTPRAQSLFSAWMNGMGRIGWGPNGSLFCWNARLMRVCALAALLARLDSCAEGTLRGLLAPPGRPCSGDRQSEMNRKDAKEPESKD